MLARAVLLCHDCGVPALITSQFPKSPVAALASGERSRVALRAAICACRLPALFLVTMSAAALASLRCTMGEKDITPDRSSISTTAQPALRAHGRHKDKRITI